MESEQKEIEKEIASEEKIQPTLTVPQIKFFLTALKKGDADDFKYRKTLITVFVNTIYLYDDRITLVFNSGDEPVTINDLLLSEIDEYTEGIKGLFLDDDGPPKKGVAAMRRFSYVQNSLRNLNTVQDPLTPP